MTRDETLKVLNANLDRWQIDSANKFIIEYLLEKNIELDRIQLFIKTLMENPIMQLDGTHNRILEHVIDYFLYKHSINSLSINNKTFYYF